MNFNSTNCNASLRSRRTRNNKLRTETMRRNSGPEMAVSTDVKTNRTRLFIDPKGYREFGGISDDTVELSGHEARTLFRLLAKHYGYTKKSLSPVKAVLGA